MNLFIFSTIFVAVNAQNYAQVPYQRSQHWSLAQSVWLQSQQTSAQGLQVPYQEEFRVSQVPRVFPHPPRQFPSNHRNEKAPGNAYLDPEPVAEVPYVERNPKRSKHLPTTKAPPKRVFPNTTKKHQNAIKQKGNEKLVGQYYYGRKGEGNSTFPLGSCFYNPSGFVCCNLMLNELMSISFEQTRSLKGSDCNLHRFATRLQKHAETIFATRFESIVSLEDFSQKVHFREDLVCKMEIAGKFLLAYATPQHVALDRIIPPVKSHNVHKDSAMLRKKMQKKINEIDDQKK